MEQNNRPKPKDQKAQNDQNSQSNAGQNGNKPSGRHRPNRGNNNNNGSNNNSNNNKQRNGQQPPQSNNSGERRGDQARRNDRNRRNNNRDNHAKNEPAVEKQPIISQPEVIFESNSFGGSDMLRDDYFGYFTEPDANVAPKYTFTEEELNAILAEREPVVDDRPHTEVIGIRFKKIGKMYYFDPNGHTAKIGDAAVVETARGIEFGQVCLGNRMVPTDNIVQPLRPVVRIANEEDRAHYAENSQKEAEAFRVCIQKITEHGLDMKLVDAQYTFDNSKLIFYFTSSGRVDFRDLVKDLASVFRIRIELRQIGIRDEAKLMGGLGACGRPLCCASFLSDFVQVSIKMAKEQSLSLNSNKISGACGRLMCCLRYEYDTYQEEISRTPPVDSVVDTPDGRGTVIEISPLAGNVKVKINDGKDIQIKTFKRDLLKIVSKPNVNEEKNN